MGLELGVLVRESRDPGMRWKYLGSTALRLADILRIRRVRRAYD
jgi:hypothetical protein